MSLARAIALFFGLLTLDGIVALVLLIVAGVVAPKGLGTTFSTILGGVLLTILAAHSASVWIYVRMLATGAFPAAGRYLLAGLFVIAVVLLYLATVLVTLVVFNR
ncbi:MAG: hypothetical protein NDJ92_15420 [Thermoanaerobaculia bacterium]|nr:hypothetical protein [Thermoanaerobaculia bacterium]